MAVKKNKVVAKTKKNIKPITTKVTLYKDIKSLIEKTQIQVAYSVNSSLVILNWQIGKRIQEEILKNKRAEYGSQIVATLSQQLTTEYGQGYTSSALTRMLLFYKHYLTQQKVATLSQQFSWSHIIEFLTIKDATERSFYEQIASIEKWSVRQLRERINSMLFQRTAISKKPKALIKQELIKHKNKKEITNTELVFKDPYLLDFLGLKDTYSEKDLESSILNSLQKFIIELGSDFAFIARQKRIIIDSEDYHIDLLFYHRGLKRLIAIDLKLGKFKASYKGQMELYLRWLQKYEVRDGEDTPIGLILCAEKSDEHIELLQLEKSNIKVAEYLTALPSKKLLEKKLHQAVASAQKKFNVKIK